MFEHTYTPRLALGPNHPLLYNGYRVSFPKVKRPELDVKHSLPSSAEIKERVQQYLYPRLALYGVL